MFSGPKVKRVSVTEDFGDSIRAQAGVSEEINVTNAAGVNTARRLIAAGLANQDVAAISESERVDVSATRSRSRSR